MDLGSKEFCPTVDEAEVQEVSGSLDGPGRGAPCCRRPSGSMS